MDAKPPDPFEPPKPNPYEAPSSLGVSPLGRARRKISVVGAIGGGLLVGLASVIAFVVTCVPLGAMTIVGRPPQMNQPLLIGAWVVSGVAATIIGRLTYRTIFTTELRELPPPTNETRPR